MAVGTCNWSETQIAMRRTTWASAMVDWSSGSKSFGFIEEQLRRSETKWQIPTATRKRAIVETSAHAARRYPAHEDERVMAAELVPRRGRSGAKLKNGS